MKPNVHETPRRVALNKLLDRAQPEFPTPPCAKSKNCPRYVEESSDWGRKLNRGVVYGDKVFIPHPPVSRWGLDDQYTKNYGLYENYTKLMAQWVEHERRKENIDLFDMLLGSPMTGAVGTKEFIDCCWVYLEACGMEREAD